MPIDRILLVSATEPGDRSVGAMYLRDLCATLPPDTLAYCPAGDSIDLLDRVTVAAGSHDATLLWFVLDDASLYREVRRAASTLRLPVITTVWDPPELVAGTGDASQLMAFADAMHASAACGVVSEPMAIEFAECYGVHTIVVRQGVEPRAIRPAVAGSSDGALHIAFAGSVYSHEAWHALSEALDSVNWHIAGRRVKLEIYGQDVPPVCQVGDRVTLHGWCAGAELVDQLAQADLCYLPSWFHADDAIAARLSFPTKFSTYLAAGCATLVHAPAYAACALFAREHDCAAVCASLRPDDIVVALEALALQRGGSAQLSANRARVLDGELSMRCFRSRFDQLLALGRHAAEQARDLGECSRG